MGWFHSNATKILNVVVLGNDCSGYGLIQQALARHEKAVFHSDLFHHNENIRKQLHESYFGKTDNVKDWYVPDSISASHYLSNKIFDNALYDEAVVGLRVNYNTFLKHELDEFFRQRCRTGSLCMVHVHRNPVACFIAKEQKRLKTRNSIYIDYKELTDFVRKHHVATLKLQDVFEDYIEFAFHEVLLDYTHAVQSACQFLELPFSPDLVDPGLLAYHHSTRYSVVNWKELLTKCDSEVRAQLESPDFF
jgi:hypothetical protein